MGTGDSRTTNRPPVRRVIVPRNDLDVQGEMEGPLEGFPPKIREAFKEVAHNNSTVIISRVPGPATLRLIDEGYDLKGYHIKAKSCDWGPMAGFLCKQPLFNKKGVSQIVGNLNSLVAYRAEMEKVLEGNDENRKKDLFPGVVPSFEKFDPFVPIKITDKRKKELLNPASKLGGTINLTELGTNKSGKKIFVGCYNKSPKGQIIPQGTIAGIFALVTKDAHPEKKEEPVWQIHYGPIRIFWKEKWVDYDQDFLKNNSEELKLPSKSNDSKVEDFKSDLLFPKKGESLHLRNKEKGKEVDDFLKNFSFTDIKLEELTYFPVYGLSNPDTTQIPPKERSPKAAVTGDYDIFCYWPLKGSDLNEEDFQRQADKNFPNTESDSLWSIKPMTLKMNLEKQVTPIWIEFIPHYKEIGPLESPDFGNFNRLGNQLKTKLNEAAKEKKEKDQYTIVKHSDEGGRPSIDEIDLPLYIFHPMGSCREPHMSHSAMPNKRLVTIINFVDHLERIIEDFKKRKLEDRLRASQLTFNHAWIMHLCLMAIPIELSPKNYGEFKIPEILKKEKFKSQTKDQYYTKFEKLFVKVNKDFLQAVDIKIAEEHNQDVNDTYPTLSNYRDSRKKIRLQVLKILFGIEQGATESDDDFSARVDSFLADFTRALIDYTFDKNKKAKEGKLAVRNCLLSQKLTRALNG